MSAAKTVTVVLPGDARPTANRGVWPKADEGLDQLIGCLKSLGVKADVPYRGFISSQAQCADVFKKAKGDAIIAFYTGWAFSGHLSHGLLTSAHAGKPLLLLSNFDDTNFAELYEKIECTGTEEVEGELCYKVVCTPKDAPPVTSYYSKETGREVKMVFTFPHQMGKIEVENLMSDYKEVDGILLPHRMVEKAMVVETLITITGYEHNVDLPEDRFDPPAAVKALLERAGEAEGEKDGEEEDAAAEQAEE